MHQKVIYYQDELNDEFAGDAIQARLIDDKYKYYHKSIFKSFTHFFWYRVIATPIAYAYMKFKFKHKIVNRKVVKPFKKKAYFIYGNHTHNLADAVIPTMVASPTDTHVIVHANNVSMPYLGRITPSLGAVPLPDTKEAMRNFTDCLEYRIKQKRVIAIYPEAHIWPFYTKIRPFKSMSFSYPIRYGTPVFCFTNTYQKRKRSKNPRIVTYVDGPFFPNLELTGKEQREDLRNRVYNTMVKRSENSNIEIIKYVKRETEV
ncbi:MAG: hypothetical protein E7176_06100 [Erysipelotrichaceae bacterium]|nr:hypothetical protein [Erysipelotrichaceae bacterium]